MIVQHPGEFVLFHKNTFRTTISTGPGIMRGQNLLGDGSDGSGCCAAHLSRANCVVNVDKRGRADCKSTGSNTLTIQS